MKGQGFQELLFGGAEKQRAKKESFPYALHTVQLAAFGLFLGCNVCWYFLVHIPYIEHPELFFLSLSLSLHCPLQEFSILLQHLGLYGSIFLGQIFGQPLMSKI